MTPRGRSDDEGKGVDRREDEVLRELWEDGAETPEISEALGKSREAILHRARTLALPAHVSAPRP